MASLHNAVTTMASWPGSSPVANFPAAQRAASDKRINPRWLFAVLTPTLLLSQLSRGAGRIYKLQSE